MLRFALEWGKILPYVHVQCRSRSLDFGPQHIYTVGPFAPNHRASSGYQTQNLKRATPYISLTHIVQTKREKRKGKTGIRGVSLENNRALSILERIGTRRAASTGPGCPTVCSVHMHRNRDSIMNKRSTYNSHRIAKT